MNRQIEKLWRFLRRFLTVDIWHITEDEVTSIPHALIEVLKTVSVTIKGISSKRLTVRASALTYSSLLATVPLLAIIFAIARGFGLDNLMERQIAAVLGDNQETVQTVLGFVDSYLNQTKNGVIIGVGIVVLLWTVLNLVNNIEVTFNNIWMVKKQRSVYRMFTDYLALLLLMPLLLIFSGGLSIFISTLTDQVQSYVLLAPIGKFFVKLTPFVLTWCMFTGLYMFMPNTKVKFRHALIAGIIAGTAYQLFQYLYISGQIWVSKYNAIYGSFAALPLFLLWMQISWTICLFGVELTYAMQNIKYYDFENETRHISRRYSDFISLRIMSEIARGFEKGDKPYQAVDIARRCHAPIRLTQMTLNELMEIGLIHEVLTEKEENAYLPSVDIATLTVAEQLKRLNNKGKESFKVEKGEAWDVLQDAQRGLYECSSHKLVKDLVNGKQ